MGVFFLPNDTIFFYWRVLEHWNNAGNYVIQVGHIVIVCQLARQQTPLSACTCEEGNSRCQLWLHCRLCQKGSIGASQWNMTTVWLTTKVPGYQKCMELILAGTQSEIFAVGTLNSYVAASPKPLPKEVECAFKILRSCNLALIVELRSCWETVLNFRNIQLAPSFPKHAYSADLVCHAQSADHAKYRQLTRQIHKLIEPTWHHFQTLGATMTFHEKH